MNSTRVPGRRAANCAASARPHARHQLRRAHEVVQVDELRLERLHGAELEGAAGEVGRALYGFADRHYLRSAEVVGCGVFEQQIAVGGDGPKD